MGRDKDSLKKRSRICSNWEEDFSAQISTWIKPELLMWAQQQQMTKKTSWPDFQHKKAGDRYGRDAAYVKTGRRIDSCGTARRPGKMRLAWFWKTTQAHLSERKDWVHWKKQGGRPTEMSSWKKAGWCLTEWKALEKSIVARIVREPELGLLNPSEINWKR